MLANLSWISTGKKYLVLLGSQRTQELGLFVGSLETTVSKLGTGVDELEIDSFQMLALGVLHQRLSEDQRTLLHTNNGTLDHDPVFVDFTVMNEATHGGNSLLCEIGFSRATGFIALLSDAVNLFVHFSTVEVSVLTSTGNSGGNTGRVPRSNTGNLSKTTVGLTGKTSDTPTSGDTFVTTTLGDSNNIDLFVLGENRVNRDFLFEQRLGEINLGSSVSSVDLNFHDVGFLHAQVQFLDLSVSDDTDNRAEFLDAVQFGFNFGTAVLLVLLGVLGVGLFLGLVPVLVHASSEFITQVLSENSGQRAETLGSFHVTNNTNDNHRRSFDDGDSVDDFTLVHEGTGTVDTTDNMRHTGLVTTEGSQVRGGTSIVLRERTDATKVSLGTLLGQESQVTATGSFEFTMRPVSGSKREYQVVSNW